MILRRTTLALTIALLAAGTLPAMESPKPRPSPTETPLPEATPFPSTPPNQASAPFVNDPTFGGLQIDPTDVEFVEDSNFSVVFPTDMVGPESIDQETPSPPLTIDPPVNASFRWDSPTQGTWYIEGPLLPAQTYRVRLAPGLKDLAGQPLPVAQWGAEFKSTALSVGTGYEERSRLNARPQVPLEFNYPVRLSTAASGIYFQDRETRERFDVEVLLNRPDFDPEPGTRVSTTPPPPVREILVRPRASLPPERRFDLVVAGVRDLYGDRTLPYPKVFALGTTRHLAISWVGAFNFPGSDPYIEIKFKGNLDDSRQVPAGAIQLTPPVPDATFALGSDSIIINGSFDTKQRYVVDIAAEFKGESGFRLPKAERWGATFRAKESAVLFPGTELRQRSEPGLRFACVPVNVEDIKWRLARVPIERLVEVTDTLRQLSPDASGEPMIDRLALPVIASGELPASTSDVETVRAIDWAPQDQPLSGPCVIEVIGKAPDGRTVGNRSLVVFSEWAMTRKQGVADSFVRVVKMRDGSAAPAGSVVQAITRFGAARTSAVTDDLGIARFSNASIAGLAYFQMDTPGGPAIQAADGASFSSGYPDSGAGRTSKWSAFFLTDRPLYRPGEEVKMKGFVRLATDKGALSLPPAGRQMKWVISKSYEAQEIASGTAVLNASGGWDASWQMPADPPQGYFRVNATIDGEHLPNQGDFQIEEYRIPAFSVSCSPEDHRKAGVSAVSVRSQLFHGPPNAGAKIKWTATWIGDRDAEYYNGPDPDWIRIDLDSEKPAPAAFDAVVSGEAFLDADGGAVLTSTSPFPDRGNRAHATVYWKVEVTGADGQTITAGTTDEQVPMEDILFGVNAESPRPATIEVNTNVLLPFGTTAPEKGTLSVYRVQTKTVREILGTNIYRYRNTDQFDVVKTQEFKPGEKVEISVKDEGVYTVVLGPLPGAGGFPVSDSVEVVIPTDPTSPAEVATTSPYELNITIPDKAAWSAGETLPVTISSPGGGVAWLTVETGTILESHTVSLPGSMAVVPLRLKPEFAPNATITAYVLKPGEGSAVPGERFGYQAIAINDPSRDLGLALDLSKDVVQPREKLTGRVVATSEGRPIAGAELTVFAVDDAILELGSWSLASVSPFFYPIRSYGVRTLRVLSDYVESISPQSLTQKGFTVGDGGGDDYGSVEFTRRNFKPLILWLPSLKTDAKGEAKFQVEAPDNLTRFRVIAYGQTPDSRFGGGSTTFEVTRDLTVEPALPRFVRQGDEVELRVVVRRQRLASDSVTVSCAVEGLKLVDPAPVTLSVRDGAPAVARFRAQVPADGITARVSFRGASAAAPTLTDSVETTLPVAEPVVLAKETVAGGFSGSTFDPSAHALAGWKTARGIYDLSISTSEWLPDLLGLPMVLDYPHGCFEQKSSRLLVLTGLGRLLNFLPDSSERRKNYDLAIASTLKEFDASILPSGLLPYWSGGTTGNVFVTIQAAWAVQQAVAADLTVPETLLEKLTDTLSRIVNGRTAETPSVRALALLVASQLPVDEEETAELKTAAEQLYLDRDKLTPESRAALAIALSSVGNQPKAEALVSAMKSLVTPVEFDPRTFTSASRTESLSSWAQLVAGSQGDRDRVRAEIRKRMQEAPGLSTQENLWLLMAFNAMIDSTKTPPLATKNLTPKPLTVSANKASAGWGPRDVAQLAAGVVKGFDGGKATFVMSAATRSTEVEAPMVDKGIRVERVVHNLTDKTRNGTPEHPFVLGDQLLISYRLFSPATRYYLAVTDTLPAGVEVVNPNLALFASAFSSLGTALDGATDPSHSEMRDQLVNLYFDRFEKGSLQTSVLARATAAGVFRWPSTQAVPMYDSRVFGRSASSVCVVKSE